MRGCKFGRSLNGIQPLLFFDMYGNTVCTKSNTLGHSANLTV